MLGGFLQSILQSVCYKEIQMSLKVRVIPSGTLSYGHFLKILLLHVNRHNVVST